QPGRPPFHRHAIVLMCFDGGRVANGCVRVRTNELEPPLPAAVGSLTCHRPRVKYAARVRHGFRKVDHHLSHATPHSPPSTTPHCGLTIEPDIPAVYGWLLDSNVLECTPLGRRSSPAASRMGRPSMRPKVTGQPFPVHACSQPHIHARRNLRTSFNADAG